MIYINNFITPIERVLLEQNHHSMLNDVREILMEKVTPDIGIFVEIKTNKRIKEIYYDWSAEMG